MTKIIKILLVLSSVVLLCSCSGAVDGNERAVVISDGGQTYTVREIFDFPAVDMLSHLECSNGVEAYRLENGAVISVSGETVRTSGVPLSLALGSDGNIYVLSIAMGKNVNIEFLAQNEAYICASLGSAFASGLVRLIRGSGEYTLFFTSGAELYGYDSNGLTRLFALADYGIYGGMSDVEMLGNGVLRIVYDGGRKAVELTPSNVVKEKQKLVIATVSDNIHNLNRAVGEFNISSNEYVLEVRFYGSGVDGQQKLLTEITAGKVPDMIDVRDFILPRFKYPILFEDLLGFIAADAELEPDDFYPNIIEGFSVDGGLYSSVSQIGFGTLCVPQSVPVAGWNWGKFVSEAENYKYPALMVREDFLEAVYGSLYDDLVNWDSGAFDSGLLAEMLELANRLPSNSENIDWSNPEMPNFENSLSSVAGSLILFSLPYSSFEGVSRQIDNMLNTIQNCRLVGWPDSGGGYSIASDSSFSIAICVGGSNKDAAWSFVRRFFTEEYQRSVSNGEILTNRKAMETRLNEVMQSGDDSKLKKWTDKEYEAIMKILESPMKTSSVFTPLDPIYAIITEDAAPYFAGQKSLDEVCKIIQSRVEIYMNEQM
jgi:ABC-type glycerol-3-phosphate transport system substrate-binding protein